MAGPVEPAGVGELDALATDFCPRLPDAPASQARDLMRKKRVRCHIIN
jgi:hypothetical protein